MSNAPQPQPPVGQDPISFYSSPRIWEDTPKARLDFINKFDDQAFHLPDNFIETFVHHQKSRTEAGYLTSLTKGCDDISRVQKEAAMLWVITGDFERCQYFINHEHSVKKTLPYYEAVNEFQKVILEYQREHTPKGLRKLEKQNIEILHQNIPLKKKNREN